MEIGPVENARGARKVPATSRKTTAAARLTARVLRRINCLSTATKRLPRNLAEAIYASPNRHAINIYHFYNHSLHHRKLSTKTKTLRYPASPAVNPRRAAPRSEKPLRASALRHGCRNPDGAGAAFRDAVKTRHPAPHVVDAGSGNPDTA